MKFTRLIVKSVVCFCLTLGFIATATASLTTQNIYGSYAWMDGEDSTSDAAGRIEPVNQVVNDQTPTCEFKAILQEGLRVLRWMRYKGPNLSLSSSYEALPGSDGLNPLVWTKNDEYGKIVTLGLVVTWIKYKLAYAGGTTTEHLFTNRITIANCTTTKTGYTFANSWTNSAGKSFVTGTSTNGYAFAIANHDDNAAVNLYPKWIANAYTVTFDANGGSGTMSEQPFTYDVAQNLSKSVFTRSGFTFAGWNTQADGKGTSYSDQANVKNLTSTAGGAVTLYAQWTAKTYTVSFNGNGGSSPSSMTVTYGSTYGTLPNSTRTGYTFAGWYTAASGGDKVESTTKVTITAAQTLYAHWAAKTYTVSFDGNGGSTPSSQTVTYDSTYGTLPSSTRTGYTFAGWYTAASGGTRIEATTKVTITAAQTLYAHWTAKTYTVTFNANGGVAPSPGSKTVTYDSTYGDLPTTTWVGHAPVGWYTGDSGGSQVHPSTTVAIASDHTLFMHWTVNHYTVRFDGNGATSGSMSDEPFSCEDEKALLKNKFVRTGYTFAGWNTKADGTGDGYRDQETVLQLSSKDGDVITLYAQWLPYTYTVVYLPNGGTGEMADQTFTYDVAQNLSSNAFVNGELEFLRWRCSNGREYQDGELVSNLTVVSNGVVTNVAVWAQTYYVRFDGNGATNMGAMAVQTFSGPDDEQFLSSNLFGRVGYSFQGWATNREDAAVFRNLYADGAKVKGLAVAGQTVTMYAAWRPITYFVAFDPNGGVVDDEMPVMTCQYGQVYPLPTCTYSPRNPDLDTFGGWWDALNKVTYGDEASVSNLCTTANATNVLKATWMLDVGDWSKHMHCTTLRWEENKHGKSGLSWEMMDGTGWGMGTEACVRQASGSWNAKSWLQAEVKTNGVLSLAIRWDKSSMSEETSLMLAFGFVDNSNSEDFINTRLYQRYNIEITVANEWVVTNVPVKLADGERHVYIHMANSIGDPNDFVRVDQMKWTPEGGDEPPVPGPDDAVKISSASVEGDVFKLSFTSDERFDYNLLTNANLLIDSWGVKEYRPGGGTITFEPEILPGVKQMFYKVETIQKK